MIVLRTLGGLVDRIAFCPTGPTIALGGGDYSPAELMTVGDPPALQRLLPVKLDREMWSFCFSPDGVLVLAYGTKVAGFDGRNGVKLWEVEPQLAGVIAGVDVSADGEVLAVGFLHQSPRQDYDDYQTWKLANPHAPSRRCGFSGTKDQMCRAVAILPMSDRVVVAEDQPGVSNARLHVLPIAGGRGQVVPTEAKLLGRIAASGDGKWVAALNRRSILAWGTSFSGTPVKLKNDSRLDFTGLAFHTSGRILAATSNDATVKLYDTTTWQVARTFTWNVGRLRSVAFSPDGLLAAAGGDSGKVVVWDVDV